MITCFIRYELDPFKVEEFERDAAVWGEAIPACGADLIGYFAPHEGSATVGYGVYTIESLAAYEAYRARLREHAAARDNFAFAKAEQFIRREDRLFLRPIAGPRA
ncbi:NIPSNAP family protein [Sphingomonas sp. MAH-20]|uniref:NIPSNAP family protein n=1 Tax=Sphingomonas horti TaxID=2682842 RepID=A0A6I4J0M2_9SPHN|nr:MULTISPECIES: NIPSNAP family protein [Sphingomonas]MBA2918202.1 NIPSNAP family protein [Sphingomonas sp. CGMCC 1.13658]MVO77171.1 NIPSNAP family protein [Sphingomonas horti]